MATVNDSQQFASTYLTLLNKLWESDAEIGRLRANPRRYAIEAGLPVADGAEVRVDESAMDGLYTEAQLVEDWTANPAVHVLHAPPAPVFDLAELSDLELDTVSGGHTFNIACYVEQPDKPTV